MKMPVNYLDLIPELKAWNNGAGIDIDSWIGCEGNYEHLIGYGRIFWPEFLEHDDCVFFAERFTEENYRGFMEQTKGDKAAVEAVMNHQHITDIFYNAEPKPTREVVLYIGRLLKDVWQTKLNRDFPNRKITVSFPEEHQDDLLHYEVSFFQER
jgi:hypothetical protein